MNLVFDIGGTSTKYILFDENKKEICKDRIVYNKLINDEEIKKIVNEVFSKLSAEYVIKNIAFSTLGVINSETGQISGLGAIENYNSINWKQEFNAINVYVENDGNCAALYELDNHKNLNNALLFVVGTGIGGAIVINHQLYKGANNSAGEFGCVLDLINDDYDYLNVSVCSSTYSIIKRYEKLTNDMLSGEEIFSLYENDKFAQQAINEMVFHLAKNIANSAIIFDPEIIFIGGAISQNQLFMQLLDIQTNKIFLKLGLKKMFQLQPCQNNNDANIYGALTLIS